MSNSKILTKEIAEQFLKDEDSVNLSEYTSLDDDAAQLLAKIKGRYIDLSGLVALSDTAAQELAKFNGAKLELNGLTTLSDATAGALAKMKGTLTLGDTRRRRSAMESAGRI